MSSKTKVKYFKNKPFPLSNEVYSNESIIETKVEVKTNSTLTRVIVNNSTGTLKPQKIGTLTLGKEIGGKGEGRVYHCDIPGKVCKIFHKSKITKFRCEKLILMQSNKIHIPGVCWPEELLYNSEGAFVGYLMSEAKGHELQISVFHPKAISDIFPSWDRKELVELCITMLNTIKELHRCNIIIGDINGGNLLVNSSTEVYFIDCDSFQVNKYPCPVSTPYFTPRELQGKKCSEFLRTKDQEMFAVTNLIFMTLFLGKPPYSCKGGGSPNENIKNGNFPYKYKNKNGENVPDGPWKFIWNHLPRRMKEIFVSCFANNIRPSISDIEDALSAYKNNLIKGYNSSELLPTSNKEVNKDIVKKFNKRR